MILVIAIVCVGGFLFLCYYMINSYNKRIQERRSSAKIFAQRHKLTFGENTGYAPAAEQEYDSDEAYTSSSFKVTYNNIVCGENDKFILYMHDRKLIGHKNNEYYDYVAYFVKNNDKDIPDFFMRDEVFLKDAVLKKFANEQDINFSDDDLFSKIFILQGPNEGKVRKFFDRKMRQIFVQNRLEGAVFIYKNDTLIIGFENSTTLQQKESMLAIANAVFGNAKKSL